jgi:hypothetical protein
MNLVAARALFGDVVAKLFIQSRADGEVPGSCHSRQAAVCRHESMGRHVVGVGL